MSDTSSAAEITVATPSRAYWEDKAERALIDLILKGVDAVQAHCGDGDNQKGILRRERGEKILEFKRRRDQSELVNFLAEMLEDHAGRLFRRPPAFGEDVPVEIKGKQNSEGKTEIEGWAEKIDNVDHMNVFGRSWYYQAKRAGGAGCFVDMPPMPRDEAGNPLEMTQDDEIANSRRPYWTIVTADEAIDLYEREVNGKKRLAYFRWKQCVCAKSSAYDPGTEIEQVREYFDGLADFEATQKSPGLPPDHPAYLGMDPQLRKNAILDPASPERFARYVVHEKRKNSEGREEWAPIRSGLLTPLKIIPLAWLDINKTSKAGCRYRAKPPRETRALAETTREHFRKKSGIDSFLRTTNTAVLFRAGHEPVMYTDPEHPERPPRMDQDVYNENNLFWDRNESATMVFVEPEGAALEQARDDKKDVEERAKAQSLEPLMPGSGDVTATDAGIRASRAACRLEQQLGAYVDAAEWAMDLMMQWVGKPPGMGGSLIPNLEGLAITQPGNFADVLSLAREIRSAPPALWETILKEAVRFGRLAEGTDTEALATALKEETPPSLEGADASTDVEALKKQMAALETLINQKSVPDDPTVTN